MTQIANTENENPPSKAIVTDENISQAIAEEYLTIEVTTECNSSCTHCFASAGLTGRTSLDIETARAIIKEGYELGYRTIHFAGGEPLLWPHLMQLLDEAFAKGYPAAFINTNGTLLSDGKCNDFAAYGDKLAFSVSLHGPKKLHEAIRGKGSYKKTIDGIKNALNRGLKINIYSSTGKSLLKKLPEFVDMVSTYCPGIEYLVLIQMIRVHQDSFDLSEELMDPKDFIKFVQTAAMLSLYGIRVKIMENPLVNVLTDILNIKWLAPGSPVSRAGRAVVMADRNITAYHSSRDFFGIYTPGALRETLFSEAYKGYVAANYTGCGRCSHLERCKLNGMAGPSEWFRDMHPEIPFCKRVLDEASGEASGWN